MIKVQTQLKIADNSGVKKAQCIKIYKGQSAKIGDIVLVTVKKIKKKLKTKISISKGNLLKALVVRTKYKQKNLINNYTSFDENSIILLNNNNKVLGTRILGPISNQLRKKKQLKILSIASTII